MAVVAVPDDETRRAGLVDFEILIDGEIDDDIPALLVLHHEADGGAQVDPGGNLAADTVAAGLAVGMEPQPLGPLGGDDLLARRQGVVGEAAEHGLAAADCDGVALTRHHFALNQVGAYKDKVVLWGDGSVYREMMCSDDLADACVYLMENKDYKDIGEHVNITDGTDIQLKDLFAIVKEIVGFEGKIEYDRSKPNGTPRKQMDATRIKSLGWQPKIPLKQGIKQFYEWYVNE